MMIVFHREHGQNGGFIDHDTHAMYAGRPNMQFSDMQVGTVSAITKDKPKKL